MTKQPERTPGQPLPSSGPEKFNWEYGDLRFAPPPTRGEGSDADAPSEARVELFDPDEYAKQLAERMADPPPDSLAWLDPPAAVEDDPLALPGDHDDPAP